MTFSTQNRSSFHLGPFRLLRLGLVLLLSWAGLIHAEDAVPTYAEWRENCAKLPTNRKLGARVAPAELLPLKSFAELDRMLNEFIGHSLGAPLATSSNWVGEVPDRATFFNPLRGWFVEPAIPFEPFARKLALPAGSRVVLQGDLHGDIHSLLAVLDRLNDRKWLDGFKVVPDDLHLVFLGDYTDRGMYGVEVLYTLLRLKVANPERVHFCRGNHEELDLVARYGFLAEGQAKFGRSFNAGKILRAYDFLPVVTYLGSGTNFAQVNHGGMEPGFVPGELLEAPGRERYQLLGRLRQAAYLERNPAWLTNDTVAGAEARRELRDFTPLTPTLPSVIGFMWNDFTVFSDESVFTRDPGRAFVFGEAATRHILQTAGKGASRVRTVIRAHQHSGIPNPLMRRLVASRGLFRHWQETNSPGAAMAGAESLAAAVETKASRTIPEGSVWTFNVSPDSVYGLGCGFGFVTFGVLHLADRFEDWRIEVESFDVPGI
ncbi:MAG TPA: hypothetical protein DCY13_18610 [Verrucomicrobiales bacterium]|nr:hypothetical protein [Verrucomicrobiales bacterium]